jgi:hypothetical protein
MSANGFCEDELITGRMKSQTRIFLVVSGRLRPAYQESEQFDIATKMVNPQPGQPNSSDGSTRQVSGVARGHAALEACGPVENGPKSMEIPAVFRPESKFVFKAR